MLWFGKKPPISDKARQAYDLVQHGIDVADLIRQNGNTELAGWFLDQTLQFRDETLSPGEARAISFERMSWWERLRYRFVLRV